MTGWGTKKLPNGIKQRGEFKNGVFIKGDQIEIENHRSIIKLMYEYENGEPNG